MSSSSAESVAASDHSEEAEVPALISFTSGTTGTPKGAVISSAAMAELAYAFSDYFETGPDDSTLIVVPIFHNTGFADQLAHMVASGGRPVSCGATGPATRQQN